jgi:hypothetical protein
VLLVVSMTFLRSAVFAIFAIILLLTTCRQRSPLLPAGEAGPLSVRSGRFDLNSSGMSERSFYMNGLQS